jgi:hypothetical protein
LVFKSHLQDVLCAAAVVTQALVTELFTHKCNSI